MATCTNKHTAQPVSLNATGFLRLKQLVGDSKANPPIPPLVPIGATSIWRRVKLGTFPEPIKLGPMTTVWRAEDIRAWIEGQGKIVASNNLQQPTNKRKPEPAKPLGINQKPVKNRANVSTREGV